MSYTAPHVDNCEARGVLLERFYHSYP
eukprot:COSAG05_NODE_20943_length_275_cov_1.335227_1_plen_26_part_01